jgi:hypothetical protein
MLVDHEDRISYRMHNKHALVVMIVMMIGGNEVVVLNPPPEEETIVSTERMEKIQL